MAFDPNLAIEQLIQIYQEAYIDLLERIAAKRVVGRTAAYEETLLRDVYRILTGLREQSYSWAEQVIPRVYSEAAADALRRWQELTGRAPQLSASFARIHRSAVQVLVTNFQGQIDDALTYVGRRVRDEWRRVQLQVIAQKLTTGLTVREAQKAFQERVAEEGLGAFRDSLGRVWRLDRYAEMVARTVTAEATNAGIINQTLAAGGDLVWIAPHFAPCERCASLENRVYSITGRTPGYPVLEVAYGGYLQIHPNCQHRASPYVRELDPNPERTQRLSNRSFEIDPRSEEERRYYENTQRMNRLRRQRRELEERLAVLPDGEEKERVRERLRAVRSQQRELSREQRDYLDAVQGVSLEGVRGEVID